MTIRRALPLTAAMVLLGASCDRLSGDQRAGAGGAPSQESAAVAQVMRPHKAGDPHAALAPEKLLQVALQHKLDGRPGEALVVLSGALEKHPEHAGLLGARGALNLEQQRYSAALSDLEVAAKRAPRDPAVLTNRAQAYRQFERVDEALADLDLALAIDPDFVPARFNRGAILFTRGEYPRALADFDHCVAVEPHAAAPYFNRAVTRDALEDGKGAIADLDRFLQLTDNEAWKAPARELLGRWRARSDNATAPASTGRRGG